MITGHFQGRVLSILSKLINPASVLEIGTFTGYSAICLAEGLRKDGQLHTIDINEELHDFQRKYFDASSYGSQIHQYTGLQRWSVKPCFAYPAIKQKMIF